MRQVLFCVFGKHIDFLPKSEEVEVGFKGTFKLQFMCNKKNGKQVEVSFKGCFYNVLCITEKVYILHKRPGQQVEVKGLNEILLCGLVFETKSH